MKTAVEYYNKGLKWLKVASRAVGIEFWSTSRRITLGRVSILVQLAMFFSLTGWTGYRYRGNWLEVIESQALISTAVSLAFKYFAFLPRRNRIRLLTVSVETKLYSRYRETSSEYPVVLKYGRLVYIVGHALIWGYYGSLCIFGINPLLVYLTERRLVLVFFFEIPTIDWTTTSGYWITTVTQFMFYISGICGMILMDYMCAFLSINGLLFVDIMIQHLDELGKQLIQLRPNAPEALDEVHRKWRQCLVDHQDIVEFFDELSDLWSIINLAQVACSVASICINMLLAFVSHFYGAYAVLVILFVDLSVHFLLGGMIERKVDDLDNALIRFPWYLLNVQQQKEYKLMVMRAQKPFGLSIAGLASVNYETYSQIMKMLYQLFALAINFLK